MVDRDVFDRRLAKLEELLRQLRNVAQTDRATYMGDDRLQACTERWLQLAAECTLDLAHHLIADRGWKTPRNYRESFQILQNESVLPSELSIKMQNWAGLRNVLVQVYLELDHKRIYGIVQNELDQLEQYATELSRAIADFDEE